MEQLREHVNDTGKLYLADIEAHVAKVSAVLAFELYFFLSFVHEHQLTCSPYPCL